MSTEPVTFHPPPLGPFIQQELDKYGVEVGIFEDRPAANWKKEQKQFAGGPANKVAGKSEASLQEIFKKFDVEFNLLLSPWRNPDNDDVVKLIGQMIADMSVNGNRRQPFLNAAQAVVRNPILRGDYGENSKEWAKKKGFNRLFINTATMFKAIIARMK